MNAPRIARLILHRAGLSAQPVVIRYERQGETCEHYPARSSGRLMAARDYLAAARAVLCAGDWTVLVKSDFDFTGRGQPLPLA